MKRENISLSCYAALPRISGPCSLYILASHIVFPSMASVFHKYFARRGPQKLCVLINNSPQLKQRLRIFKQIILASTINKLFISLAQLTSQLSCSNLSAQSSNCRVNNKQKNTEKKCEQFLKQFLAIFFRFHFFPCCRGTLMFKCFSTTFWRKWSANFYRSSPHTWRRHWRRLAKHMPQQRA